MAKNRVEYNGYVGEVFFDDGILHVKALYLRDALIAEVEGADAQTAFQHLIDDYIQTCSEIGREPNKPFSGSFNIRIPSNLHRAAATKAGLQGVSLNAFVEKAIEEKCNETELEPKFEARSEFIKAWIEQLHRTKKEFSDFHFRRADQSIASSSGQPRLLPNKGGSNVHYLDNQKDKQFG